MEEGGPSDLDARPGPALVADFVRVVHVVRHGEAGDGNWPLPAMAALSPTGQAQARRAAADLAMGPGHGTRIFASDLPRCRETAETIASALQGRVVLDRRLRELDFGWEGLEGPEVLKHIGEDRLAAFLRSPARGDLPGAEPFLAFWERVRAASEHMLQLAQVEPLVLVAHDGVNRALALMASGRGPDAWSDVRPWRHGEVRTIVWREPA